MTAAERILLIIVCTFAFLATLSMFAAIFVPGFRETGTPMTVGILGALTTFAGIFTVSALSRGMKQVPDEEAKKEKEEKETRVS